MKEYNIGDIVVYTAFGGIRRTIVVTDKTDDIKNGRPGFAGFLRDDVNTSYWGYDSQIVQVNPKRT